MKSKITLLNMISGIILQLVTIIFGFVLPRVILSCFGSNVNGLVSSINQFLGYIALIEGGVSGVIVANLYKPLVEKNNLKLSAILTTADKFYKKIAYIFIVYSILLACFFSASFKSHYSVVYTFSLVLILSITQLIQYMFALPLRNLLSADKKIFVGNTIQIIIIILNLLLIPLSTIFYPSIHILKLISGCLYIIQPILLFNFANKYYNIDWDSEPDYSLIKERWNGFAINLAAFIHNCVDVSVLTIFTDLATVSVYSVYSLVCMGLKQIVNACMSGIAETVGQAYAKGDNNEVNQKLDIYEYIVFVLVFFFFTVGALLITPFVQLYTKNVTDANYYQPTFGILLLISEALYLLKLPHMNLSYAANKFKEITIPCFIEAGLNIVISIILVRRFELIGVAIGTIVGMAYRTVFHVYFTSKLIQRPQRLFYFKFILFTTVSLFGFMICSKFLPVENITIFSWIIHGIYYSLIIGALIIIGSLVFFGNELRFFKAYLFGNR